MAKRVYGWYSAKADAVSGHAVYPRECNGEPVKVTNVQGGKQLSKGYLWDDVVFVGALEDHCIASKHRIESGRHRGD